MKPFIRKLSLFLNAFLFMNVLFLSKELYLYFTGDTCKNKFVLIGIIAISVFILCGLLGLIPICSKPKTASIQSIVKRKENATGTYYFGYFSLFVLLFFSFDLSDIISLILYFVVFFALAFVYCRNDLIYINPTILLIGKRIYNIEVEHNNKTETVLALTNTTIDIGKKYKFYFSSYEFTICEEVIEDTSHITP